MDRNKLVEKIKNFPDTPGVYLMHDREGTILYVGKATSLKRRVLSYFQHPQESRIEVMLAQVNKIETKDTDSAIEALLLESNLIKMHQPKYNLRLKDNKTYIGIFVTNEDWPRIFPARITESLPEGEFFGPFPAGALAREALKIIRKIFPYRVSCKPLSGRGCLESHLGLCPGMCNGKITQEEYLKIIKQIKQFLRGNKKQIIREIEIEMKKEAKLKNFEKAAELRNRLFALKHIQDVAIIMEEENIDKTTQSRIEAYDISNISGQFAVASMVVFTNGEVDKNQYRKFKIKSVKESNDIAMIKEVMTRRLAHNEWPQAELILIDGGKPQVNAVKEVLARQKIQIPVVGIAKGPKRNKNEFVGLKDIDIDKRILIKLRDEAHRFAIEYYRLRHRNNLLSK